MPVMMMAWSAGRVPIIIGTSTAAASVEPAVLSVPIQHVLWKPIVTNVEPVRMKAGIPSVKSV